jgi:hypothetical protein
LLPASIGLAVALAGLPTLGSVDAVEPNRDTAYLVKSHCCDRRINEIA